MNRRTNWAGTVTFGGQPLAPVTLEEARRAVVGHAQVTPLGTGHSFSPVAQSPGHQVHTTHLPVDLSVSADRSTVTVGAGMTYGALGSALHAQGLALAAMASLPHISVGGAIATGTHGSGDAIGTLSSAVRAVDIITADGETRRVSSEDDDFAGWVVGVGMLGLVTRVTLAVEPTYDVAQTVLLGLSLDDLEENFDAVFGAATSVSVFTRWRPEPDGQIWLKRRLDREGTWASGSLLTAAPAVTDVHPLEVLDSVNCTPQCGRPGPWHERLPHFRMDFTPSSGDEIQAEYLVPRANAVEAIGRVRRLGPRITPLLHVTEIRTMAADDLWLSPAYGRETVGIHFTWHKDPQIFTVLPDIESELASLGARPHWGKVSLLPPDVVARAYPRWDDFRALANSVDPRGRFGSPMMRHLLDGNGLATEG